MFLYGFNYIILTNCIIIYQLFYKMINNIDFNVAVVEVSCLLPQDIHTYKFSRHLIFAVFMVDLLSAKFSSSQIFSGTMQNLFKWVPHLLISKILYSCLCSLAQDHNLYFEQCCSSDICEQQLFHLLPYLLNDYTVATKLV